MAAFSSFTAGAALAVAALLPIPGFAADARHPLVIELFQSQGCSSCPPANANLIDLAKRDDVLALNFAVDYWDRLGWKDTFATPEYTARQYAYAHALGNGEVYTPQAIVNGRADTTGLDTNQLLQIAARSDRGAAGPLLTLAADSVTIGTGAAPSGGPETPDGPGWRLLGRRPRSPWSR